ncbi:MAG: hypothetical protein ACREH5_06725, partial [Candidatus Omnitrophota bacterium]
MRVIALLVISSFFAREAVWAADPSGFQLSREKKKEGKFLPRYLLEQQQKHEDFIQKKQDETSITGSLEDDFTARMRKKKAFFEDDRRRGGAGEGRMEYTLGDEDANGNPTTLNIYEYADNGDLSRIVQYDVSGVDISQYVDAAEEIEGTDGKKFKGGFENFNKASLTDDMIVGISYFEGEGEDRRVSHTLGGFEDETNEATQISVYEYDGGVLKQVLSYNIEELSGDFIDGEFLKEKPGSDVLSEDNLESVTFYTGEKDKERVSHTFSDFDDENDPTSLTFYEYDGEALREVRSYSLEDVDVGDYLSLNTEGEIQGFMTEEQLEGLTVYEGEKGKERIVYSLSDYYTDENTGERLFGQRTDYSYDGEILDETKTYDVRDLAEADKLTAGQGELLTITDYVGDTRGKETISTILSDFVDGEATRRQDYEYSQYRRILESVASFYVDELDPADRATRGAGSLINRTFYAGAKGSERVDSIKEYNLDGEVINVQKYVYEGRASRRRIDYVNQSDPEDPSEVTRLEYTGPRRKERVTGLVGPNDISVFDLGIPPMDPKDLVAMIEADPLLGTVIYDPGDPTKPLRIVLNNQDVPPSADADGNGILDRVYIFAYDVNAALGGDGNPSTLDSVYLAKDEVSVDSLTADDQIAATLEYLRTNTAQPGQLNVSAATEFRYDHTADNRLNLVHYAGKKMEYTYGPDQLDGDPGPLVKVTSYVNDKTSGTDNWILSSETNYQVKTDESNETRVSSIVQYKKDGTVKSTTNYTYASNDETAAGWANIDFTLETNETGMLTNVIDYFGLQGRERIASIKVYKEDGTTEVDSTLKSESLYLYTEDVALGQAVSEDLDVVREYRDGILKSESFYAGRQGKEKVDFIFGYNASGTSVRFRTEYVYDEDSDDGLDGTFLYNVSGLTSQEQLTKGTGVKKTYTHFVGFEGTEIVDYSYNLLSNGNVNTTTVFYYEGGIRAGPVVSNGTAELSALVQQDTYRVSDISQVNELTHEKRKSSTYFDIHLGKGEEKVDFTQAYRADGVTVRNTTISYYEGGLRASGADTEDALIRTEQFRGGTEGSSDTSAPTLLTLQNITYFQGEVSEEKVDFAQNYLSDGATVRNTQVSFYEGDKRAADATADEALIRTELYRGGAAGSDIVGSLILQTVTYFFGLVGEEKVDFTQNYRSDGSVRNTALSFYEGDVRAEDAAWDAALIRTEQFRGGTAGSDDVGNLKLQTASYFKGLLSEEKLDFTQNYFADGTTVRNTQISIYEGEKRAEDAGPDEALIRMELFRGGEAGSSVTTDLIVQTKTYFQGEVTEEKVDFIQKYRPDGLNISATTINWYFDGVSLVRATDAAADDPLAETHEYRGGIAGSDSLLGTDETAGTLDDLKLRAKNYFKGAIAGEEKVDYVQNYMSDGVGIRNTAVSFYEGGLRASQAGPDVALVQTRTFKGDATGLFATMALVSLGAGANRLLSDAFFQGAVGEEKADYSLNYKGVAGSETIRNTAVSFYEGGKRALAATPDEALILTRTFNGNMIANLGTVNTSNRFASNKLLSEAFFQGAVGEEKQDFTLNFRGAAGSEIVRSTQLYFYEGNKRALAATPDEAMIRTETYRGGAVGSDNVSALKLMSKTYFQGAVGEEKSDFTQNYKFDGIAVSSTQLYFYEGNKRALAATPDEAMTRTELYRGGQAGLDTVAGLKLKNMTYYQGEAGEEKSDFSQDYKYDGLTVHTTQISFYEGNVRASHASVGPDTALIRTALYRGGQAGSDTFTSLKLKTMTYYKGAAGEEKSDFSQNYKSNGTTVRNTTVYFYEGEKRAALAGPDDPLIRTETYRGGTAGSDVIAAAMTLDTITYYKGTFAGEEKADYTQSYKPDGTTVHSTQVSFYRKCASPCTDERAEDVGPDDPLSITVSYRGDKAVAAITDPNADIENRESKTFYLGNVGEEIADYTLGYMIGTTVVKATTVNFYGDSLLRASSASPDDPLRRTVSYKKDQTSQLAAMTSPGAVTARRISQTFYVGEKGEEIADYTENFRGDGTTVRDTVRNRYNRCASPCTEEPAGSADPDNELIKQITYAGTTNIQIAVTFFEIKWGQGFELADYTVNYDVITGTHETGRSINTYAALDETGEGVRAASTAGNQDMLRKTEVTTGSTVVPTLVLNVSYFLTSSWREEGRTERTLRKIGSGAVSEETLYNYTNFILTSTDTFYGPASSGKLQSHTEYAATDLDGTAMPQEEGDEKATATIFYSITATGAARFIKQISRNNYAPDASGDLMLSTSETRKIRTVAAGITVWNEAFWNGMAMASRQFFAGWAGEERVTTEQRWDNPGNIIHTTSTYAYNAAINYRDVLVSVSTSDPFFLLSQTFYDPEGSRAMYTLSYSHGVLSSSSINVYRADGTLGETAGYRRINTIDSIALSWDASKGVYQATPTQEGGYFTDSIAQETLYDEFGIKQLQTNHHDLYGLLLSRDLYLYGASGDESVLSHVDHYEVTFAAVNEIEFGGHRPLGANWGTVGSTLDGQTYYSGPDGDRVECSYRLIEEVKPGQSEDVLEPVIISKLKYTFNEYSAANPYLLTESFEFSTTDAAIALPPTSPSLLNLESKTTYIPDPNGTTTDAVLVGSIESYTAVFYLAFEGKVNKDQYGDGYDPQEEEDYTAAPPVQGPSFTTNTPTRFWGMSYDPPAGSSDSPTIQDPLKAITDALGPGATAEQKAEATKGKSFITLQRAVMTTDYSYTSLGNMSVVSSTFRHGQAYDTEGGLTIIEQTTTYGAPPASLDPAERVPMSDNTLQQGGGSSQQTITTYTYLLLPAVGGAPGSFVLKQIAETEYIGVNTWNKGRVETYHSVFDPAYGNTDYEISYKLNPSSDPRDPLSIEWEWAMTVARQANGDVLYVQKRPRDPEVDNTPLQTKMFAHPQEAKASKNAYYSPWDEYFDTQIQDTWKGDSYKSFDPEGNEWTYYLYDATTQTNTVATWDNPAALTRNRDPAAGSGCPGDNRLCFDTPERYLDKVFPEDQPFSTFNAGTGTFPVKRVQGSYDDGDYELRDAEKDNPGTDFNEASDAVVTYYKKQQTGTDTRKETNQFIYKAMTQYYTKAVEYWWYQKEHFYNYVAPEKQPTVEILYDEDGKQIGFHIAGKGSVTKGEDPEDILANAEKSGAQVAPGVDKKAVSAALAKAGIAGNSFFLSTETDAEGNTVITGVIVLDKAGNEVGSVSFGTDGSLLISNKATGKLTLTDKTGKVIDTLKLNLSKKVDLNKLSAQTRAKIEKFAKSLETKFNIKISQAEKLAGVLVKPADQGTFKNILKIVGAVSGSKATGSFDVGGVKIDATRSGELRVRLTVGQANTLINSNTVSAEDKSILQKQVDQFLARFDGADRAKAARSDLTAVDATFKAGTDKVTFKQTNVYDNIKSKAQGAVLARYSGQLQALGVTDLSKPAATSAGEKLRVRVIGELSKAGDKALSQTYAASLGKVTLTAKDVSKFAADLGSKLGDKGKTFFATQVGANPTDAAKVSQAYKNAVVVDNAARAAAAAGGDQEKKIKALIAQAGTATGADLKKTLAQLRVETTTAGFLVQAKAANVGEAGLQKIAGAKTVDQARKIANAEIQNATLINAANKTLPNADGGLKAEIKAKVAALAGADPKQAEKLRAELKVLIGKVPPPLAQPAVAKPQVPAPGQAPQVQLPPSGLPDDFNALSTSDKLKAIQQLTPATFNNLSAQQRDQILSVVAGATVAAAQGQATPLNVLEESPLFKSPEVAQQVIQQIAAQVGANPPALTAALNQASIFIPRGEIVSAFVTVLQTVLTPGQALGTALIQALQTGNLDALKSLQGDLMKGTAALGANPLAAALIGQIDVLVSGADTLIQKVFLENLGNALAEVRGAGVGTLESQNLLTALVTVVQAGANFMAAVQPLMVDIEDAEQNNIG